MKPLLLAFLFLASARASARANDISPAHLEFFESKIRPILAEHCYPCHNSIDKSKGDLALDYRDARHSSKVILPGNPEKSPLLLAVRHDPDYEPMPSKAPKLSPANLRHLEEWIRMGAPDPRSEKPTKSSIASTPDWPTIRNQRALWWSFQPIVTSTPPPAADPAWNTHPIDRFLYASLQSRHLSPAPLADPATLVRRLHLVLTGLPPSTETLAAFLAAPTDSAYATLVDQLLASPRYGERWARYWMDWFRYAESHGSEGDPEIPYVSRYRDYLIRAFNENLPADSLIREHLAGDLLPNPRLNPSLELNESAIATAQFRLVPHGFGVIDAYAEQIAFTDNQIDVISKAFLGLTVSCARCHHHKFDPISQQDYYKFYGMMISSRPAIRNVDSPERQNLHRAALEKLQTSIRSQFSTLWLSELDSAIALLEKAPLLKLPDHHPLAAWAKLRDLPPPDLQSQLATLAATFQSHRQLNEQARKNATFYADLRDPSTYDHWFKTGNGLSPKVSPAGSFALAPDGPTALTGIYPAGIYSHLLSEKHSAFLNSPFHLAAGKNASIHALGSLATARFVVRNYPLVHGGLHPNVTLKPSPAWINLPKYDYWNGEQGFFQINTAADNTVQPGPARSWFGLLEVYAGPDSLRELGAPLASLPPPASPITDRASLLLHYRSSLHSALTAWSSSTLSDSQASLLDAFLSQKFLSNSLATLPPPLLALIQSSRALETEIPTPQRAPGVLEAQPWAQPLLTRGDPKQEAQPVPHGFLEALPSHPYPTSSSGRLDLAEDLLSPANPLTSRVLVNRLWHHTFGRGIVASTDNFGRLGSEPSHPQLLDFLATDLRDHQWSIKYLLRSLVLSRAFRSASAAPPENLPTDPENIYLAHFSPRRLDAEAILDSIQFLSSTLPPKRALFSPIIRNRLNPFLTTFNFPIPTSTVGNRSSTNVPAQALTLLNGPIVQSAALQWSKLLLENPLLPTETAKISALFLQAYSRPPSPDELAACLAFIHPTSPDSQLPDPFFRLTHAILNSKELLYVH